MFVTLLTTIAVCAAVYLLYTLTASGYWNYKHERHVACLKLSLKQTFFEIILSLNVVH